MKREINLLYAWSVMTGVIIGSGIFVNPTAIMIQSGSVGLSLILWLVSGILECLLALCYCELACMFPKAGGVYAYLKVILPYDFPAFLAVWNYFVSLNPSFYAILAVVSAKYILQPFFAGCDPPEEAIKILTVWILISVMALNSVYTKHVARAQTVFMICKIIPLIIIIIVGLLDFFVHDQKQNLMTPFADSNWSVKSIFAALLIGSFNYGGWQYLYNLCEEVKYPEKIVPRTTVLSMCTVIFLYLLTNFCYMIVLTRRELVEADTVALSFAEKTINWFVFCVPFMVVTSTIGSLNGAILGGSRMIYAAARDGLFPEALCYVHTKYQSPWPSVWVSGALAIIYALSGSLSQLIDYQVFTASIIICICLCSAVWLRWAEPDKPRPFKLPLPFFFLVICATLLLVIVNVSTQPRLFGIGLLLMFSAIPVYLIFIWGRKKTKFQHSWIGKFNFGLQKCLKVTAEKLE